MASAVKRTEESAPLNRCGQEVLNQLDKWESNKRLQPDGTHISIPKDLNRETAGQGT